MNDLELVQTDLVEYKGVYNWSLMLLKDETKQLTGAFKIRGVRNKFKKIDFNKCDTVITASTGNHGQAVALCAKYYNKKCIIVVPETTPKCKIKKISAYSPTIVNENLKTYDECKKLAEELAKQHDNYVYIPSFDDYDIIEGHITMLKEINWEGIDYCFCPVGGGGLVSACLKFLKGKVKVIGVEVENKDAMKKSLKSGNREFIDISKDIRGFEEGILVSEVGKINFEICKNNKLQIETVTEDEIQEAIKKLSIHNNIKAEGAGAAALACALKYKKSGKKCVCIVSGGNIDDSIYEKIINNKEII